MAATTQALTTWRELVRMPDAELAGLDIAAVNLACVSGLPDAGDIDRQLVLDRLNEFARRVAWYTDRVMPEFRRSPQEYEHSEAYFRSLCLITVLQRDLGVRYNPAKIPEDAPFDTADVFVHGPVIGPGGTCANLPVVYAAVGRRLGYPIKLATARGARGTGHLFCRWDDPDGERVNIEGSGLGMCNFPDDHYRTGMYEVDPAVEKAGCLLRSQTPGEELAGFLGERGYRWLDLGNYRMACEAFAWSYVWQPDNRLKWNKLVHTAGDWAKALAVRTPPGFPPLRFKWQRQYPAAVPPDLERDLYGMALTQSLLDDPGKERRWWGPMRRGEPVNQRPTSVYGVLSPERCEVTIRGTRT